jgi:XapX domain-containing protein
MKMYIVSMVLGLIVGAFYALANVRSPAPPPVALVGLFAIFLGQQLMTPLIARFHAPVVSADSPAQGRDP